MYSFHAASQPFSQRVMIGATNCFFCSSTIIWWMPEEMFSCSERNGPNGRVRISMNWRAAFSHSTM